MLRYIYTIIIIFKINNMTTLKVHTIESAPEASKPLEGISKAYGMIQDCTGISKANKSKTLHYL
jgi:hypothetical protein